MMEPYTNLNRGFAFVTFTKNEDALEAVRQVNLFLSNLSTVVISFCWGRLDLIEKVGGTYDFTFYQIHKPLGRNVVP